MFNLGSKKQSASSVWNIKLLTKEYLVEGTFHPKEYELGGDNVFALAATSSMNEGGIDAFQRLRLFNTHIQPTGNLIILCTQYKEIPASRRNSTEATEVPFFVFSQIIIRTISLALAGIRLVNNISENVFGIVNPYCKNRQLN